MSGHKVNGKKWVVEHWMGKEQFIKNKFVSKPLVQKVVGQIVIGKKYNIQEVFKCKKKHVVFKFLDYFLQ